jgi:5-methylcytosine-specific restriction endonuclease McrA
MIKLEKTERPQVLTDNADDWTAVLLEKQAQGEEPTTSEKTKYRHRDIKAALLNETHGKCAYCESKLRHITYGDVEHIVPKSLALAKIFDWANLTLACDVCNTNKGSHPGNHDAFVDPYRHDPEAHLEFCGPLVLPRAESDPGLLTERVLELNRGELVERRASRIRALLSQVQIYARTQDPEVKRVLKEHLEQNETLADQEYAGLARWYIKLQMQGQR